MQVLRYGAKSLFVTFFVDFREFSWISGAVPHSGAARVTENGRGNRPSVNYSSTGPCRAAHRTGGPASAIGLSNGANDNAHDSPQIVTIRRDFVPRARFVPHRGPLNPRYLRAHAIFLLLIFFTVKVRSRRVRKIRKDESTSK